MAVHEWWALLRQVISHVCVSKNFRFIVSHILSGYCATCFFFFFFFFFISRKRTPVNRECNSGSVINPLTPELNPSAQRRLTRFLPGILLL
jgi:hypothetical protein